MKCPPRTDKPEHFAHDNTAYTLSSVWLAGRDLSRESRLFRSLGARLSPQRLYLPEPVDGEVAAFERGAVLLLPESRQTDPGRPISGLTIAVKDLTTTLRFLGSYKTRRLNNSVFVPPDSGLGYWLEFRQQ